MRQSLHNLATLSVRVVKDKWLAHRDKDNLEKDTLKAAQVESPSDAEELTRLRKEKQKNSMRQLRIHLPPQ